MAGYHIMWLSLLVITLLVSWVLSDTCDQHATCSSCIRDSSVCVWCATNNFKGSRCKSLDQLTNDWCPNPDMLQNPIVNSEPSENKPFSSNKGKVVQIQPQSYKINLRPGIPVNFTFSYKPSSNYPVDMYFLFDTSSTMKSIRGKIMDQSISLYETMNKLTEDMHLGMGTFVDKNTLPYTDIINKNQTYSFRNNLRLQEDPYKFQNETRDIAFGYNFDRPEGGLDALAQVLSCGNEKIGWRAESRKLVVFVTDAPYHVAGDGMLAGIYAPFDGKCYTNKEGVYTNELEMDYPSVSMINKLAADEEIQIIFAVTNYVQTQYSHLSAAIVGSHTETVNSGSTEIGELLTEIYRDITRKIKLRVNFKSGQRNKFEIKFNPDCTEDNVKDFEIFCNLKEGEEKTITGTIKALEHFGSKSTSVDIIIEGIKEKFTLDVNFIEDCKCGINAQLNSSECNNGGTLNCGICTCNNDRYGANCACVKNSASRADDNSNCVQPGDELECSGHGSCICGKCICRKNSPYEGKYCQFNKDNCPRNNNTVCSNHGQCQNEKCTCLKEWEGSACECPKSNATCIGTNGKVCNGLGRCQCGKCECHPTPNWDARDGRDAFCHMKPCRDCHEPQCDRLRRCALCLHSNQECEQCQPFKGSVSENIISSRDNSSWSVCPELRTEVGCYTRYMYRYPQDEYIIELVVQAKADCLENYYKYGGIALVALIAAGIAALLVWKWVTHARDRREYERFLKEYAEDLDTPHENACYLPASNTFSNPMFRRPSLDVRN